jgi:hypothetical protein
MASWEKSDKLWNWSSGSDQQLFERKVVLGAKLDLLTCTPCLMLRDSILMSRGMVIDWMLVFWPTLRYCAQWGCLVRSLNKQTCCTNVGGNLLKVNQCSRHRYVVWINIYFLIRIIFLWRSRGSLCSSVSLANLSASRWAISTLMSRNQSYPQRVEVMFFRSSIQEKCFLGITVAESRLSDSTLLCTICKNVRRDLVWIVYVRGKDKQRRVLHVKDVYWNFTKRF